MKIKKPAVREIKTYSSFLPVELDKKPMNLLNFQKSFIYVSSTSLINDKAMSNL